MQVEWTDGKVTVWPVKVGLFGNPYLAYRIWQSDDIFSGWWLPESWQVICCG